MRFAYNQMLQQTLALLSRTTKKSFYFLFSFSLFANTHLVYLQLFCVCCTHTTTCNGRYLCDDDQPEENRYTIIVCILHFRTQFASHFFVACTLLKVHINRQHAIMCLTTSIITYRQFHTTSNKIPNVTP